MAWEVKEKLTEYVSEGIVLAFGPDYSNAKPLISTATKPEFGDYQSNAALPLAKRLKMKPDVIAVKLIDALDVQSLCDPPTNQGGFINFRLKTDYVAERLELMLADEERLGIVAKDPKRVVIDFSSPNIAKDMHVGHLRSTIIGECLSRTLEFLGNDVLRLNHVGDWGTQFGKLILHLKEVAPEALTAEGQLDLGDLVEFYKAASKRATEDKEFEEKARLEVVKLQAGDEDSMKAWNLLCDQSRKEFQQLYDILDVTIQERGESFYNPYLPAVIEALKAKELAVVDEGATVVFLENYKNRKGKQQPLIVKKSDGGYMYSTTDLAAIRHRTSVEKAERILYVTDMGQATHFDQVFQVARRAQFLPEEVSLEHVPFGLVLGEDGKRLATRSGETIKLKQLLEESVTVAEKEFRRRIEGEGRTEDEEYIHKVSRVIGISAVKYADLKNTRTSDYRFSFDRMLSLEGNTAPYMLYAYARIQGIFRKIGATRSTPGAKIVLVEPQEKHLGRLLVKLPEMLEEVENQLKPHLICDYLFDLSQRFNQFYQTCSIIGASSEEVRVSRLALADLTARTIKLCLSFIGIPTLDRI